MLPTNNEVAVHLPRPAIITSIAAVTQQQQQQQVAASSCTAAGSSSKGLYSHLVTTSEVNVQPVGSVINEYCCQHFTMSEKQLRNTIRRIRENDPTFTTLDLRDVNGSRSYVFESGTTTSSACANAGSRSTSSSGNSGGIFMEMIEALTKNTTIKSVSIVLRFLHKLSVEEKIVLFRTIGSLPNLTELRIASMGLTSLALRLVNEILQQVIGSSKEEEEEEEQRLEVLTLQSMQYRGSNNTQSYYNNNRNRTIFAIPAATNMNTNSSELQNFLISLKQLRNLKSFELKDAQMTFDLNELVLNGLVHIPTLTRIGVNSHEFPNNGEPRLSQQSLTAIATRLPNLYWLSLRRLHLGPILPNFLAQLIHHPTLECLILEQNLMGAGCAVVLDQLLEHNSTLRDLYLAYNMIPDDIGAMIANAISRNTNSNIRELDIAANEIGTSTCEAFAQVLRSPTTNLEFLNLSQHSLPVEGINQIASALRSPNTKLKSLALMEVQMNDESGIAIATALQDNTKLERLNFSYNRLGNRTCLEIATVLKTNDTIKSINLCSNRVSNPGAIVLADALLVNTTLEQLNLVNNYSMGTVAYDAFEVMIQENMTIQHLWLPTTLPKSTIPSYLRLNRLDRRKLLAQEMDNPTSWLQAIDRCQDDHIALYYLIRSNPNVVSWMEGEKKKDSVLLAEFK